MKTDTSGLVTTVNGRIDLFLLVDQFSTALLTDKTKKVADD